MRGWDRGAEEVGKGRIWELMTEEVGQGGADLHSSVTAIVPVTEEPRPRDLPVVHHAGVAGVQQGHGLRAGQGAVGGVG